MSEKVLERKLETVRNLRIAIEASIPDYEERVEEAKRDGDIDEILYWSDVLAEARLELYKSKEEEKKIMGLLK